MVTSKLEVELALERLLDHLESWLRQQPEWATILAAGDRQTRKRAAEAIAKSLTTIPTVSGTAINRAARRRMFAELDKQPGWWEDMF